MKSKWSLGGWVDSHRQSPITKWSHQGLTCSSDEVPHGIVSCHNDIFGAILTVLHKRPSNRCGRFAQSLDPDELQEQLARQYFNPQRPARGRGNRGGASRRPRPAREEDDGDDAREQHGQHSVHEDGPQEQKQAENGDQEGTSATVRASGSGSEQRRKSHEETGATPAGDSESSAVIDWASDAAKKRHRKRYNIPPKSNSAVLLRDKNTLASSGAEHYSLDLLQWGLIPAWSKEPPEGGSLHTINCTCESLSQGTPLWRSVRDSKRCIVVADGFYEWLTKGKDKLPNFIKPADGRLLCMAGLYDHATFGGNFDPVTTFTIITVPANKQMSTLHHRMPAILRDPEEVRLWLSEEKWSKPVEDLIRPYENELTIYQVPKGVGKVGNESPTFIEPIKGAPGTLETMFAKQSSQGSPASSASASTSSAIPKSTFPSRITSEKDVAVHKRKRQDIIEVINLLDDSDGATESEGETDLKPVLKSRKLSKAS
ncbi:BQ2448_7761 [Microbotryum intermedium]|uniref:BQ2448_7761 protein n=1 Tax=Microbotryum intermedium TaxID=269621 RepID=A0A238FLS7_9BASI|nr:BQ2448_7761 [Microbotryum intermedium]